MRSIIVILATAALALSVMATPVDYAIDVNHSNVGFEVPILNGLSTVRGKFSDFKMELSFDEKDVSKSSVKVVIPVSSIDTGIDARDKHLRSPDFFDADKYPEITFVSKTVEKKGKSLLLTGELTMHGVTKTISFPFSITGRSVTTDGTKENYGFTARLKLNRRDYGINREHPTAPGFVGDNIDIVLNVITKARKL